VCTLSVHLFFVVQLVLGLDFLFLFFAVVEYCG
jgi:hypothetical protein